MTVAAAGTFVVDTSSLAKLFLEDEGYEAFRAWFGDAVRGGADLLAPELLRYEIGNVVQREYGEATVEDRVEIIVEALRHLRPEDADVGACFEAAGDLTFYDAAYLALARDRGATLVTWDRRLAERGAELGLDVERR